MRSLLDGLSDLGGLLSQLGRFMWRNKLWWMVPVVLVLVLVIVLVVLAETPLAPFIYTLF